MAISNRRTRSLRHERAYYVVPPRPIQAPPAEAELVALLSPQAAKEQKTGTTPETAAAGGGFFADVDAAAALSTKADAAEDEREKKAAAPPPRAEPLGPKEALTLELRLFSGEKVATTTDFASTLSGAKATLRKIQARDASRFSKLLRTFNSSILFWLFLRSVFSQTGSPTHLDDRQLLPSGGGGASQSLRATLPPLPGSSARRATRSTALSTRSTAARSQRTRRPRTGRRSCFSRSSPSAPVS